MLEVIAPIQDRRAELLADPAELSRLIELGATKAQALAGDVLAACSDRYGVRHQA